MYSEKMPHKRLPVSGNNGFDTSQRRGEGSFQRGNNSSGSGAQVVVNTNDDDEKSREQKRRGAWVEPRELPPASRTLVHHQAEKIEGNAPLDVKQLCLNTYASYGVDGMNEPDNGDSGNDVNRSMFSEAFGYSAGRQVRFVRMDVQGPGWEPLSSSVSGPTLDLGPASISSSQATNHSSSIPGICIKPEAQSVRFEAEITIDRSLVNFLSSLFNYFSFLLFFMSQEIDRLFILFFPLLFLVPGGKLSEIIQLW